MSKRIKMIQGSSISKDTFNTVEEFAKGYKKILICLDSNHTHEHVLAELNLYAPLVSKGSYCVVFDTMVEDMPEDRWLDRPWGKSNNPKTAVLEYLKKINESSLAAYDGDRLVLTIDKQIENQLLITVAPDGFLRRE